MFHVKHHDRRAARLATLAGGTVRLVVLAGGTVRLAVLAGGRVRQTERLL